MIDKLDYIFRKIPILSGYYLKNAAKLKRSFCHLLNRFGLLKPVTFVQWLATNKCNFTCPYCEASSGKAFDNELTTEEAEYLVDDLAKMKVKRFLISGGEALMRPDIISIMRRANDKKMKLGLVTNGYLVEKMWEELRHFNYFLYFTSIDGIPEYNNRVRGRENAFEHAIKGLELFEKIGVPTRMINTVVHPDNIDQLEELLGILKNTAVTEWHLTPTSEVGKATLSDKYILNKDHLKYLVGFMKKNKNVMKIDFGESHTYVGCFDGDPVGKPFFCGAGLTRCAIMADGEVLGCQQVYDNTFSEGNIRDKPFSRIWKEEFKRFRVNSVPDPCKSCSHLDACQGGCWAEMQKKDLCLKAVWEGE